MISYHNKLYIRDTKYYDPELQSNECSEFALRVKSYDENKYYRNNITGSKIETFTEHDYTNETTMFNRKRRVFMRVVAVGASYNLHWTYCKKLCYLRGSTISAWSTVNSNRTLLQEKNALLKFDSDLTISSCIYRKMLII